MSDRPIIIQNSNTQWTNGGCGSTGCGSGCGLIILIALLLWPISMTFSAIDGEAAWWWIPLGIFLTLIEIGLIGLGVFAFLDKQFGWGYLDGTRNTGPAPNTIDAEEIAPDVETSNYGTHSSDTAAAEGKESFQDRMAKHRESIGRETTQKPKRSDGPLIGQSVNLPQSDSQPDVYERLKRLKGLLDEGHITQEEYDAKKADLLQLL